MTKKNDQLTKPAPPSNFIGRLFKKHFNIHKGGFEEVSITITKKDLFDLTFLEVHEYDEPKAVYFCFREIPGEYKIFEYDDFYEWWADEIILASCEDCILELIDDGIVTPDESDYIKYYKELKAAIVKTPENV